MSLRHGYRNRDYAYTYATASAPCAVYTHTSAYDYDAYSGYGTIGLADAFALDYACLKECL